MAERITKAMMREAARILRLGQNQRIKDRTGIGGRPKILERCPAPGCGFEGGFKDIYFHLPYCEHNRDRKGGPLTLARWMHNRKIARASQPAPLKRAS